MLSCAAVPLCVSLEIPSQQLLHQFQPAQCTLSPLWVFFVAGTCDQRQNHAGGASHQPIDTDGPGLEFLGKCCSVGLKITRHLVITFIKTRQDKKMPQETGEVINQVSGSRRIQAAFDRKL